MLSHIVFYTASILTGAAVSGSAAANVAIGKTAPDFTLTDSNGKSHSLSDYKGSIVVLEWNNPGCPFMHKHYASGNIPKQQAAALAEGVIWLAINSGAPGKQGHLDGDGANAFMAEFHSKPTAYLLDPDGTAGHLYNARTTPHMYVIDKAGVLRYMGGIDSIASTDQADIPMATQYVTQALGELQSAKPVSVPVSRPYGCSVKYAD